MSANTNIERNITTPLLLKTWYVGMFFCTASLYVLGIISRDNSDNSCVVLGIIAMFITPVENIIKAASRNNELKKEYEERKRKAAETRGKQSDEERREQERERIKAANELAKRHAAKSRSAQNV